MLMLVALAHQSLRAHRHPGEELSADGPGGADGRRG
jgi:multicomponent K+:H+ antiporter subunit A